MDKPKVSDFVQRIVEGGNASEIADALLTEAEVASGPKIHHAHTPAHRDAIQKVYKIHGVKTYSVKHHGGFFVGVHPQQDKKTVGKPSQSVARPKGGKPSVRK